MRKVVKKKHTQAKIKCRCGQKLKLPKVAGMKMHAHCRKCNLEWHRVGNHIYAHPFYIKKNKKDLT